MVRMRTRADWRRWLARYHATTSAVWLAFPRKALGEQSLTYAEAVEEALCIGWIDGVMNSFGDGWFALRFTPRKPRSIWSKANVERVSRLTADGLMRPEGLAVYEAALARGAIAEAYAIKDDVDMPPEFEAALDAHQKARATFDALSPSQQRMWTRYVVSVKQSATREKRAAEAITLMLAGHRAGETDAQATARGLPTRAAILGRR